MCFFIYLCLLEAAASTQHLIHLMASFSPLFPGLTAGDTISPEQDQLTGTEGKSVTMKCNYQTADSYPRLYWYKHDSDRQFLISHTGTSRKLQDPVPGFSFKVSDDQRQMDLQISSAAVTDSAVYYCAVRHTVTGNNKTSTRGIYIL
uniref:Ig-like domain-containing protein n=1 Tax=Oryzias latipes TaxID=8090 RepID=A0A3B3IPB2_ORYLA